MRHCALTMLWCVVLDPVLWSHYREYQTLDVWFWFWFLDGMTVPDCFRLFLDFRQTMIHVKMCWLKMFKTAQIVFFAQQYKFFSFPVGQHDNKCSVVPEDHYMEVGSDTKVDCHTPCVHGKVSWKLNNKAIDDSWSTMVNSSLTVLSLRNVTEQRAIVVCYSADGDILGGTIIRTYCKDCFWIQILAEGSIRNLITKQRWFYIYHKYDEFTDEND